MIFAAGDMVSGGPATDEVIDLLVSKGVRMVRGDSDTDEKMIEMCRGLAQPDQPSRFSPRHDRAYYENQLAWNLANLSESGRTFLAALPLSETVEVAPGHRLFVCHASPHDPANRVCGPDNPSSVLREAFGSVDADVIAFGHSHTPYVRLLDGKLMVNVASVAFRPDATSILTFITYRDEQWVVQQHHVPYDAAEEARQMEERGVPVPLRD
jgi:predicted phosphodiesterase